jgi:sacsin
VGWSASPEIATPGGPLYNFVKNSQEPDMKKQLAAFRSIATNFDTEFQGTIIRLPLRTEAQAKRSKIVADDMFTPEDEIVEVFHKFSGELAESLLFLRNLRSITLRIDDEVFAKAEATIPMEGENLQAASSVNQGYKEVFVKQSEELCEADFMMDITFFRRPEKPELAVAETKIRYAISHRLQKAPVEEGLEKWSRSQKLFPWIAVASPLDVCLPHPHILSSCSPLYSENNRLCWTPFHYSSAPDSYPASRTYTRHAEYNS